MEAQRASGPFLGLKRVRGTTRTGSVSQDSVPPPHTHMLSDDSHELPRATDVKDTNLTFPARQSSFLWTIK